MQFRPFAFVVLLALAFHGGAASAETSADWDAVIAAAKKEGRVTVYSAQVGLTFQNDIAKAFEAKYGIEVRMVELRATDIRERIRTEQAAGQPGADISYNGTTTSQLQEDEGRFQPHGFLPNFAAVRPEFSPNGTLLPISIQGYGILVNTRLVKPADEPKSWHDLLDPKWAGKIHADDQRFLGNGGVLFYTTYAAFGRDYQEKLAAQQLNISREFRESERRVARGEFPLYIPFALPNLAILKGLPIKAVLPSEGILYVGYVMGILKEAAHPNAARLLMNFFIEKSSALEYAKGAFNVPVDVPLDQLDPYARSVVQAKLLGTTDAHKINDVLGIAKEIYK